MIEGISFSETDVFEDWNETFLPSSTCLCPSWLVMVTSVTSVVLARMVIPGFVFFSVCFGNIHISRIAHAAAMARVALI